MNQILALVGKNDAGKSNILKAIQFFFNNTKKSISIDNFYKNSNNDKNYLKRDIEIIGYFKTNDFPNEAHNGELRIKRSVHFKEPKPELSYHFYDHKNKKYNSISSGSDILKKIPEPILLPAVQHLKDEAKYAEKNYMGQLIKLLIKNIPENEFQELQSMLLKFESNVSGDNKHHEIKKIEEKLSKPDFIDKNISIDFNIKNGSEAFHDFTIKVKDGVMTQAEDMGDGFQRKLILSILMAFATIPKKEKEKSPVIFLLEEPEAFLHPHAQQIMLSSMNKLSKDVDVIYSTHSHLLVDFNEYSHIARIYKHNTHTESSQVGENKMNEFDIKDWLTYFRSYNHNHNKILFADRVVIVEGLTEARVIPLYGDIVDPTFSSTTSVISADGISNVSRIRHMFSAFNIPCYIIFDGDKPKEKSDKKIKRAELLVEFGLSHENLPPLICKSEFATFQTNFEEMMQDHIPDYCCKLKELQCNAIVEKSDIAMHMFMSMQQTDSLSIPPPLEKIVKKIMDMK